MKEILPKVKVAVLQAAPVLFNLKVKLGKTCKSIFEAADQGAQLILFPEAFIPAYPRRSTWWGIMLDLISSN